MVYSSKYSRLMHYIERHTGIILYFTDDVVCFLYDLGGNSFVSGVRFIRNDGFLGKSN